MRNDGKRKKRYVHDFIVPSVGYCRLEIVGRKITSSKSWSKIRKQIAEWELVDAPR